MFGFQKFEVVSGTFLKVSEEFQGEIGNLYSIYICRRPSEQEPFSYYSECSLVTLVVSMTKRYLEYLG